MAQYRFLNGTFCTSARKPEGYPKADFPEIALIGRSNVGKSSLLNHLLGSKKLAKTSRTPGKTQLINFFLVDNRLSLVDLPGYGFAKTPQSVRNAWAEEIETYLQSREQLKLLLVLLDINRTPNQDDLAFLEWARFYAKPYLIVFTKADKLKQKDLKIQTEKNLAAIGEDHMLSYVHCSIKEGKTRADLIRAINKAIHDAT